MKTETQLKVERIEGLILEANQTLAKVRELTARLLAEIKPPEPKNPPKTGD